MNEFMKDYRAFVGSRPDKFYKATLFESGRILLGLNCLEPGQEQEVHTHEGQDKFYLVLEGEGEFLIAGEVQVGSEGSVSFAPAGLMHGVRNRGSRRLILLVGIAPWSEK